MPDINPRLVKRPERTGPHVSGPDGRPSLRGFPAPGAAAQERGPHRGTVWSLHADQRSAVIRRRFPSATAAWMFAQATITQKALWGSRTPLRVLIWASMRPARIR